jgi:subtilisin family serine protease
MRSGAVAVLLFVACSRSETPAVSEVFEAPAGSRVVPGAFILRFSEPPLARGGRMTAIAAQRSKLKQFAHERALHLEIAQTYAHVYSGVSVRLPPGELVQLSQFKGAVAIFPVLVVDPDPAVPAAGVSPELYSAIVQTGVDIAHSSLGLTGQGVKVGVIDTGVDYGHPDLGGCFGPGCRVAVGYDFAGDAYDSNSSTSLPVPDPDPIDTCRGHGTHVAGIIGANGAITGVAPGVTFGVYRVFGCTGSGATDVILAGMDRAAADGMRVINMSLGGSFNWAQGPESDAAATLQQLGITVVSSIGNNGSSGTFSTGSPANGAGTFGVAAIENTQLTAPAFTVTPGGVAYGFSLATSSVPAPNTGSYPLDRTGTVASTSDACAALPAGSLSGKVALIRRGTCGFYNKAANAQAAGATGVVVYNNVAGAFTVIVTGAPAITIPVVGISDVQGADLNSRMDQGAVTFAWGTQVSQAPNPLANQVSSFSSWGPTPELGFKPDLAAPGGSIYSTYPRALGSYRSVSGTSMSSPHVAGITALMLQAQPALTGAQVQDLLRNTAAPVSAAGGGLESVLHQGAGMVRVDLAAGTRARISPSKLALGESQAGPTTRTMTFTNEGATPLTFTATHAAALSVTGPSLTPAQTATGAATVSFSAATIAVPAGGTASLDVTITADPVLASGSHYSGFLVFTAGATVLRVPYMGFKGDYQATQILVPLAAGYPWLASKPAAAFVNQPSGASYTLQGTDVPWVVAHLDHYAQQVKLEVFDAVSNKPWGTFIDEPLISKNSAITGVAATTPWSWDGTTTFNKASLLVPNGTYKLKLSALKPLGDPGSAADWETWTSPVVTINHP